MNIDVLNQLLIKHNKEYQNFWTEILEPNQRLINETTDYRERQILQSTQDKIAAYINEQSDLVERLIGLLAVAPDKKEIEYYKRYCKQARYYIKNLGGNPSLLNFIKETDLC